MALRQSYLRKETSMSLYLIFSIITAFLSLAFALLHLMASLSELRKHKNTLGNRLLLIGSNLATFSHPLLPFANCCFIPLADRS